MNESMKEERRQWRLSVKGNDGPKRKRTKEEEDGRDGRE
jgi:hypothetical protein